MPIKQLFLEKSINFKISVCEKKFIEAKQVTGGCKIQFRGLGYLYYSIKSKKFFFVKKIKNLNTISF